MPKTRAKFNVFYVLLIIVGTFFALTAFAFFVMAARARSGLVAETSSLMKIVDKQGGTILGAELGLLALCTVGAIAWDCYFDRPRPPEERPNQPGSHSP